MKTAFLKFLPIIAAVMLATSCSKDDDNNTVNPKNNKSEQSGIPFTLRVNTGTTLKKVGYAEETTDPDKKGYYNISFSDEDVNKLEMKIYTGEITDESNLLTTLTLADATTGEFTGTVENAPAADADLTAVITTDGNSLVTFSDKSLAELLETCAHKFLGTFKYGAAEVTLTDQNAYLDITYRESNKIDINSSEIAVTDSRVWVAVPAKNAVTSQALGISKAADEVKPSTIYTVVRNFTPKAFSVSPTKKVYFSRGNLQYNPTQDKWQFAAHQYDICIKEINYDVSSYNKDYDGWIDLFGWGTWLNGNDIEEPYETQQDDATSYKWSGISAIGSEWTTLTCGDNDNPGEWNYLLGLNGCTARDNAENLKHWTTVNDVPGLVILPDGYDYESIDWDNYDWADLEKAGAVFLPASGYRSGTAVNDIGDYGRYWSSSSYGENGAFGLFFGDGGVGWGRFFRYYGRSVRLVRAAL